MWLLGNLLGLPRYIWLILIGCAAAGLWLWLQAEENRDDRANQEIGRAVEREETTRGVLERVEKGNEVRETVRPGSRAIYDECLRSSRTPANCERFLSH